jgi:transcriptional regulator with XRE-family HTH domain
MLGTVLKEAREKTGLTQEQLSFQANVDRSYISQLENDHKSPTVDMLFLICKALGVRASEILAEVERRQDEAEQA